MSLYEEAMGLLKRAQKLLLDARAKHEIAEFARRQKLDFARYNKHLREEINKDLSELGSDPKP